MYPITLLTSPPHLKAIVPTARVLIIERNDTRRRLFDQTLRRSGFGTLLGATGEQAQEMIKTFQPDIMLIDLELPDVNALDLIRRIKTSTSGQPPAIIAFSERDRYHYHATEELAYFFFKPVCIIALIDMVRRVSSKLPMRNPC